MAEVEVIPFTSTEIIQWDIIGGGTSFGAELQPNSDLSGTAGTFTGVGAPYASGVIADFWQLFTDGNVPTETVVGSKTAEDAQNIVLGPGSFNGILATTATAPTLSNGTLYRARLILTGVVGDLRWEVTGLSQQFITSITAPGTYDYYFVASATGTYSSRLNFTAAEASMGISLMSLREVLTTAAHLAIAEDDGDASYIEATAAQTSNFNELFMQTTPKSITSVTIRYVARRTGGSGTKIRPGIKLNSTTSMNGTAITPGLTFVTYDDIFLTNDDTGEAWTRPEINGVGSSGIDRVTFPAVQFQAGSFPRITYGAVRVTFEPSLCCDVLVPMITDVITDVLPD